jgi:hypothetical protein
MKLDLQKREVRGGRVDIQEARYSFKLPPTPADQYTLAQIDDYMHLRRDVFPHKRPVSLRLDARVSGLDLPGTWGFGFWNDPFSAGFGAGGMRRLFPVLPNAAWFFYGSAPNHLSLREGLPGAGFHAKVFSAPLVPSIVSLLSLPAIPFLLWPKTARLLKQLAVSIIKEDATPLTIDLTGWHQYQLQLGCQQVRFMIDQRCVFRTNFAPSGRLGLVIWIDNQYFKFTPEGKIGFGFLPLASEQVLDIQNLTLMHESEV